MQKFRQLAKRDYTHEEVQRLQDATNSAIGVMQSSLIAQGELLQNVPLTEGLNDIRLPFRQMPLGAFVVRVDKDADVALAGYNNGIVKVKCNVACTINLWVF